MHVLMQRVLYFPLKPRLQALLRTPKYRKMCNYEATRQVNPGLISDVYDGDEWKAFMGPATNPVDRVGLQFVIDGIPANTEGSFSFKPGVLMNLSAAPAERGKAEKLLILLVIPTSIKDPNAKKYFDFAATYELNDLFENGKKHLPVCLKFYVILSHVSHMRTQYIGVDGVKIKVFSTSLDSPGRSELMGRWLCM